MEEISDIVDHSQDPEATYLRLEVMHTLTAILAPRELEFLRLRTEGFDYNTIARILGVRPGTVGATLARALKKIHTTFSTPRKQRNLIKALGTTPDQM